MKKRIGLIVLVVMLLMSVFATTAFASDDAITITGTIRESDGTPAEKGKYVISITTDKLVCVSGTDGYMELVPQFMDDTHVLTVKKDNVVVATADINLTRGDEYSFTATDTGADIVVPADVTKINFDVVVDGDQLIIQEPEAEAAASADTAKSGGSALLYILLAVVVVAVVVVIVLISKKKAKAK